MILYASIGTPSTPGDFSQAALAMAWSTGKGCIDGTYNVKQALHTLSQHGADSYVIFADLVKAYETVDRDLLMKIMARYGCPDELIFVLRKLCQ